VELAPPKVYMVHETTWIKGLKQQQNKILWYTVKLSEIEDHFNLQPLIQRCYGIWSHCSRSRYKCCCGYVDMLATRLMNNGLTNRQTWTTNKDHYPSRRTSSPQYTHRWMNCCNKKWWCSYCPFDHQGYSTPYLKSIITWNCFIVCISFLHCTGR